MEAIIRARPSEQSSDRRRATAGAAIFIVLAGLAHLLAAPQHLDHVGHGLFLALAGAAEVGWGIAFWRKPSASLYGLGVVLAGALIALWAMTRVVPAPFGHGSGEVEAFGIISKLAEGAGLVGLIAVVFLGTYSGSIRWPTWRTVLALLTLAVIGAFTLYGAGLAAERALPWLGAETDHDSAPSGLFAAESAETSAPSVPSASEAGPTLPTLGALFPLLLRLGYGPHGTEVEALYAPPIFFQVSGQERPTASLERPTFVFLLEEMDHEHKADLASEPLRSLLRLDGGDALAPYQVTVLKETDAHRASQVLFAMPDGMSQEALSQGKHTLAFSIMLESQEESVFIWELPLGLPGDAPLPASAEQPAQLPVSEDSQRLTRIGQEIEYGGKSGIRVEATYATPDYFSAALPSEAASRYLPDRFTTFVVSERLHTSDLPSEPLAVSMRLDGSKYGPDLEEQIVTSPHHRVTLVRFPVEPPSGLRHRVLEILLPGDEQLVWHLPLSYAGASSESGVGLSWALVLALMGGMVAAMWPCLFQLTVFFIPTMAGLSMQETGGGVALGRRFQVVKAALFFVLGFTLVYTTAGAVIGFFAGRLGESPDFAVWQRYLGIGGGILIIALALRVAVKVRAPLVCKMPILSKMAHGRQASSPLELMFAGLAFATGCMTCFGAALVVAMVVYVGLAGSAALGALILFLFSLGMGIPLVIAATAMAKVLPTLFRLEKVIPWLGLASSLLMVGFAVLLITGHYMALTEWMYRSLPGLSPK